MTDARLQMKFKHCVLMLALTVCASCAPLQPPSAEGPRGNEPAYPFYLVADAQRHEAAVAAVNRLFESSGSGVGTTELHPITSTISNLDTTGHPVYLPKLGKDPVMTEEETRESLRRFIREWQELIGADLARLSLVTRVDQPNGTKLATYTQKFRYPLRGGFGKLEIRFAQDRRVLGLSSSFIPNPERLQAAGTTARLQPEDVVKQLRAGPIAYTDSTGANLNLNLPANSQITPRELVIYVLPAKSKPDALEFHLAWEVELENAGVKFVYVDAINGEIVATA